MIALKGYQQRTLDSLKHFFNSCGNGAPPADAFERVQRINGEFPVPYLPVRVEGLSSELPYVCLRVPTGGGKTLLACYAAGIAQKEYLRADHCVVLWLVPSNAILAQTADALREPSHPYRRALELACGPVEILNIEEALRVSRVVVDAQTVVLVATIQSFRAEDPANRQVNAENGSFLDHFANIPSTRLADLVCDSANRPVPSLVNVLRLRRPVVIVDEAHNARTELSFASLGNVLPSCIVEFTATPARAGTPSNVLHRVSAAELNAADMIKLPIRLITRSIGDRNELLTDAISLRSDLERLATSEGQATGEYIRPILLIQANRIADTEPLRDQLITNFGLGRDQIAISTGELDELADIPDISAPGCATRVVITVQRLREGWDCPFAYVLCSLKETRSAIALEQIVGRILRLPGARRKRNPDLNCSYAFSVSDSIGSVLQEFRSALETNGFTPAESERIVLPVTQGALPLGLQARTVSLVPADVDMVAIAQLSSNLAQKVSVDLERGEFTLLSSLTGYEATALGGCFIGSAAKATIARLVAEVSASEAAFGGSGIGRSLSPYERGEELAVPRLAVREAEGLLEFESTFLMEQPWRLGEKDATLPSDYNPLNRPLGRAATISVTSAGRVQTALVVPSDADFVGMLHQNVLQLEVETDWSVESLVAWLDASIDHRDIPAGEAANFLRHAVRGILTRFGIADIDTLALDRHRLRDWIERRIDEHRLAERLRAFQTFLLPDSPLVTDPALAFDCRVLAYEPSWLYDGAYRFQKHYYGERPGELRELKQNRELTEEFRCAQFLDSLSEVKYWVRNLVRKRGSFRLQTSRDWFYPDFVCKLNDGRILVVEYKGGHLYAEADEKRAIGAVWSQRSNGTCVFVMPTEGQFSEIERVIRA